MTNALKWLSDHDRGYGALRRAARAAIVMPAMFALGDKVFNNADVATFAAFGSFAMLLLVDFGGPMRDRLQEQAALAVVGAVFVCVGTLASHNAWLAAAAMLLVGFGVLFVGVVSSVLAGATTALLLAFILPVSLIGKPSAIPDRLAGWGLASVAAFIAVAVLWPAPAHDPLRGTAAGACRALAARLRADVAYLTGGRDGPAATVHENAAVQADSAVGALRTVFLATPYRPTALSTATRTVVRLVDELNWLNAILMQSMPQRRGKFVNRASCAVKQAAAEVLERGADLLESTAADPGPLRSALADLRAALDAMERNATEEIPPGSNGSNGSSADTDSIDPAAERRGGEVISALNPSFRAQELSFAVSIIGGNIDRTAAAERRSWIERLLGRQPAGLPGLLSAAQERAAAHVEPHSLWLQNSIRGSVGLGIAVLVANLTGVQHSFWVVLATLSVLRSSALNTGQNAVRAVLGTAAGFAIGAALLVPIGTNTAVLWVLLPIAILIAGVAPAAISFAAGQAGFTLTLVILFNIIQPAGWRVGLLRVEDIALGCAVSIVVGVLFWPRGAAAALSQALAEAYTDSARYLSSAVLFGMLRCDAGIAPSAAPTAPTDEAARSAAAARRLDDAFRGYLAERGAKPVPLAEITSLVTGVAGLRLAADAVLDLWHGDVGEAAGDRLAARRELLGTSEQVRRWYDELAASLISSNEVPEPLLPNDDANVRLINAVRSDLSGVDGRASATAVRMVWTGDHLDAARRLQATLVLPAQAASDSGMANPLASIMPWLARHSRRTAVDIG